MSEASQILKLPDPVMANVRELIQRDDVQSVSFPYHDPDLWRELVAEQLRRSKRRSCAPQDAFLLSGPDDGLGDVPIREWGGVVHIPYEGMCGGDLVILPKWRLFLAERAEITGRLSSAIGCCGYYVLAPTDFGELGCASRTLIGNWVLYRSNAPYIPCAPLKPTPSSRRGQ